ncbi:MAG: hypothetical protein ACI9EF_000536 [Pseudohongiellaceae bacterium]|jgi:hypothetical protein
MKTERSWTAASARPVAVLALAWAVGFGSVSCAGEGDAAEVTEEPPGVEQPQTGGAQLATEEQSAATEKAPAAEPWKPQRPEFEAIALALRAGANPYLGRAQIPALRDHLRTPDLSVNDRVNSLTQLASQLLRWSEMKPALAAMNEAMELLEPLQLAPRQLISFYRQLGLIELRAAEVANCLELHNVDSCLLPTVGGGVHVNKAHALAAQEAISFCFSVDPNALDTRWLLNVVAMLLGEYPEGLSRSRRIPEAAFASEDDVGRFYDVAAAAGVNDFNLCGGVVVEDFNNDGFLDIVTSTFDPAGPLRFYTGSGEMTFEDRSRASRTDDQLGGLNCVGGDYDNDGDVDVLVLRGAWLFDDGRIRNSLLSNDGEGLFTDVTRAAGLVAPAAPSQAACFGDFDLDGDLDLYVANESRADLAIPGTSYPSQFFENQDDGTFIDRAVSAGLTNDRHAKGVTAGDYDNDGDLDLYVSNLTANRLYRNDGGLSFLDVAPALGVDGPQGRSFAAWFFDYDNDGQLDLFVGSFDGTIADIASDYLGVPDLSKRPRLYHNVGNGQFAETTMEARLGHVWLPMGANFGDIDNDGWLDMYLATGDPGYETLVPNVMLRNDGGARFLNVTTSGGFGNGQKGHGVAFADFDHDGDQDIFNQLGGFYPGDGFHNALLENPGHGHRFLFVRLKGKTSNHFGLGARLAVTFVEGGVERTVHRAVGSVSSFGGSPFRQEVGLGDAERIVSVVVEWPATGESQSFTDVSLDRLIEITEGEPLLHQEALR